MSDLMHMTANLTIHQGFMINYKLNSQFKFQREQGRTSFEEASEMIKEVEERFERERKVLDNQKSKLFRK